MRLFSKVFNKFYSPDDSSTISQDKPIVGNDKEDVINFLGEDEPDDKIDLDKDKIKDKIKDKKEDKTDKEELDKTDETDEEKDDDEESEEDDELEALLDETEEPDSEKLELVTPVRRREILKKYPTLFKDFPYLEKAYYREQQFTELLPTIDDAREAVEKGKAFDNFENDLMSGDLGNLFKVIKEGNSNSFHKIVDNLLPALAKVDNDAYTHVLSNTIKHTIFSMLGEARRSKNETLESAALILNQFVFGNSEFKAPTKLSKDEKPNEKETELKKREDAFKKQQFDTASQDLNSRVNNSIKNAIEGNIDPKDSMSEYVKRTAVREVNETLVSLIEKDSRFKTIMDKFWEDAFKKGFSRDSIDRIKSAYLSKAKTLLPSVIKKARNDALKGIGKRVRETDTNDDTDTKDKNRNTSRSQNQNRSDKDKTGGIPRGMSTLEFLSKD